jgi:hypothetical protein
VDSEKKVCRQCGATKTTETDFGLNASAPDGRRSVCNSCRRDNRSVSRTKDAQELKAHNRTVADAQKRLMHPETLTPGELKKLSDVVRLADKHREALQAKVQAAHAEQERAKQMANAAPSLKLVQERFGSPIFLTIDEMRPSLEKARVALGNLTGPDDGPAVRHVEEYIKRVEWTVKVHDEREAELATDAQEALNEKVCRRVIGRVHDEFLPQIRGANTAEAKIALREKIRARKKALLAMAKTTTEKDKSGAEKSVVANAVADALEKLAFMLYAGTKDPLPNDTLENVQSRVDMAAANAELLERAEAERRQYWDDLRASDPEQFEKESKSLVRQIKGDDYWSQMQREAARRLVRQDPVEAARRALLALQPRNVEQPNIIWVLQEGKREIWYWPMGALVKRDGSEVVYDARMKAWFLAPAPAGAQLESPTAKPFQKMEAYQDEFDCDEEGYPKWKYRPEGSGGVHVQQPDGTFKRTDNPSPWTKPEKITFRKAEPPASAAHTELRHGKFWTPDEIKAADGAGWSETPPSVLPPLPVHSVADSITTKPTTAADRAKDAKPLETVWQRSDRLRREQAAREAALLKGEQIAL